jgi:chromosome segregation protein
MVEDLDELMKKKRATAFKKIRKEFDRYFQILFEGGSADLEEVYGEPPAEATDEAGNPIVPADGELTEEEKAKAAKKNKILTGIEVIANPPGKKIKYLNAMSGGERTLTSIALICAILHNNPSPFVVLDEVEAALDEANTRRFVRIMTELSTQSQFIIVTHNRVTMHAADALYGVVMNRDGVSKLLSVKIEDVPEYETPAPAVDK